MEASYSQALQPLSKIGLYAVIIEIGTLVNKATT